MKINRVTISSGNVFADLGFANPEEELVAPQQLWIPLLNFQFPLQLKAPLLAATTEIPLN
jgi:hypothetical protein